MWIDDQNSFSSMRFFFNAPAKSSRSGRAKFLMNFIENHWFLRLWGEFFDQNFIEFLVFFFTRAEIWLHSTSSRRKNSKTRWYGLFWAGRSWRFSGSEKENFFWKKIRTRKKHRGKGPPGLQASGNVVGGSMQQQQQQQQQYTFEKRKRKND